MNSRDVLKKAVALCVVLCGASLFAARAHLTGARSQTRAGGDLSKWRPTRDNSGVGYVGGAVCAECHKKEAASQASTPMARAASRAPDCELLKTRAPLTFTNGPYTYRIAREGGATLYKVSDGKRELSAPVLFCFGEGAAAQTYVLRHEGTFYESRVSFYSGLGGLDLTINHPRAAPPSLEDAVGRRMTEEAARGCFACHTTGAAHAARFEPEKLSPGISCEACHGPGERHVAAARAKNLKDPFTFNPAGLDALDLSQEFCASCHQGLDAVMEMEEQGGAANIRFQPYRIFNSRAHLLDDKRMSCTACHDPHGPLERDEAFYDSKCTACHLTSAKEKRTAERNASACPVATRGCSDCHMPKVELPGMHFKFTDHWIRIAKPGSPVPR
ncbi:MAG TPA: multiheme c-type cytochrome [Pyrinomonadaceae bacterium]|nr:multiheme c-type cytochrome [Pyrinomonadaceae bacterium]